MMIQNIKEKVIGSMGSVSGLASILGSWQICHNVCLALIALLSVIGITLVGMPLQFLTKVAVPFWTAAVILLAISVLFYVKKKCMSGTLLVFNTGLIVAGVPFQSLQRFSVFFWIFGGIIALVAVSVFIKDKIRRRVS